MKQLICEGSCNPQFEVVMADLNRFREKEKPLRTTPIQPPPDLVLAGLHSLAHTPHERVRLNRMKCSVCGTERQWGGEKEIAS